MIEILPENLANHVEKKCGSLAGEFFCHLSHTFAIFSVYLHPHPSSPSSQHCPYFEANTPPPPSRHPWNNFLISFPQSHTSHASWHLMPCLPPGTPDFFDVIGQVAFDISYFIIITIKKIFLSTDRSLSFAFEPRTSPQVSWYEPEA